MKRCALLVGVMSLLAWAALAGGEGNLPVLKVEQTEFYAEMVTMVRIAVPTIPGFECDLRCYEDELGKGRGIPQPDGAMILEHEHPQGAEVKTKIVPSEGALDFYITVTGATHRDLLIILCLINLDARVRTVDLTTGKPFGSSSNLTVSAPPDTRADFPRKPGIEGNQAKT